MSERIRQMTANYKEGNRTALFRTGAQEDFVERMWESLGKVTEGQGAAKSDKEEKREKVVQQAQKKARAVRDTLGAVAGNAAPSPLTLASVTTTPSPPRIAQSIPSTADAEEEEEEEGESASTPNNKRGKYTSHQHSGAYDISGLVDFHKDETAKIFSMYKPRETESVGSIVATVMKVVTEAQSKDREREQMRDDERRAREEKREEERLAREEKRQAEESARRTEEAKMQREFMLHLIESMKK
jgi:hypothetical protein